MSSTVLSLLVALASVLTVGIPPIIKALHTERSVIRGKLLEIGPVALQESGGIRLPDGSFRGIENAAPICNLKVEIFLTNLGERTGHLKVGHIKLKFNDEVTAEGKIDFPVTQRSLEPNYQQRINIVSTLGARGMNGLKAIFSKQRASVIDVSGGQIVIDVINHDLSEDKIEIPIRNEELRCEYSPKSEPALSNR